MSNDFATARSNNTAGLLGLGLLFVWGCALLFWVDLANQHATWKAVAGTAGAALVSLACVALLMYTGRQARRMAELERQLAAEREIAQSLRT